jgi:PAS domain-containing protein
MTPEQIAEIGVSGKGYWLFDRNSKILERNEAFLDLYGIPFQVRVSLCTFPTTAAIYKWIPYHRS